MLVKVIKEGTAYNQKDVVELLSEFSLFKDRVEKKFKDISGELQGKSNEHDLWVSVYLIASDYAEDNFSKRQKQEPIVQKIS